LTVPIIIENSTNCRSIEGFGLPTGLPTKDEIVKTTGISLNETICLRRATRGRARGPGPPSLIKGGHALSLRSLAPPVGSDREIKKKIIER